MQSTLDAMFQYVVHVSSKICSFNMQLRSLAPGACGPDQVEGGAPSDRVGLGLPAGIFVDQTKHQFRIKSFSIGFDEI